MLESTNEVATALGEHIAGIIENFADMMNEHVKKAAAQYPTFNESVNTTSYTVSKNNKRKTRDVANQRLKMLFVE